MIALCYKASRSWGCMFASAGRPSLKVSEGVWVFDLTKSGTVLKELRMPFLSARKIRRVNCSLLAARQLEKVASSARACLSLSCLQ